MPSTSSDPPATRVYYGRGETEALSRFPRVVLQPGHHTEDELATLAAAGTQALAYLALSEDPGPEAPWHRPERNRLWGGHYVHVGDPAWRRTVRDRAERALTSGYEGLFLDTMDSPALFPEDGPALIALVRSLRATVGDRYVMVNRGFDLHGGLAPLVDGFLFEGFSTTWEGGYRPLPHGELLLNVERLHRLRGTGRELYALDYADSASLAAFARSRAATHHLPCQVSDRELTRVP